MKGKVGFTVDGEMATEQCRRTPLTNNAAVADSTKGSLANHERLSNGKNRISYLSRSSESFRGSFGHRPAADSSLDVGLFATGILIGARRANPNRKALLPWGQAAEGSGCAPEVDIVLKLSATNLYHR